MKQWWKIGGPVGSFYSLTINTQPENRAALVGCVSLCLCHYYYIFYGMEDSGILDTTNSLHMFALHLVFLPRINLALQEHLEAFNHHKMRTAQNWSPYQMWVNNMMNPANPLSNGQPNSLPENFEFYGYEP